MRQTSTLAALVLVACLVLSLGAHPALALSRTGQRLILTSWANKTTNSSLRYIHTTWFKRYYSYGATATIAQPDTDETHTVEVLLPSTGLFSASGPSVRAQASALYATALALHGGLYSSSRVGVSASEARHRVVAWTTGLAYSYQRDKWGQCWQSPLWAYYLGYGARQVWPYLTPETQQLVTQCVDAEADRLLTIAPPYFADASGRILHPGDSKSEENAWNASLLMLAARSYGHNPNASAWEMQGRWYWLTAYATPSQVGTDPRLTGSNLNANGSVTNHNKTVDPDYMFTQAEFITKMRILATDMQTTVPTETANNFALVWRALTVVKYPTSTYRKPGGTIYRWASRHRATANLYFPLGATFSQYRRFNAAETDVEAFGSKIDSTAYSWALVHLQYVAKQQSRYRDGHIFSSGTTTFIEDEQFAAASLAEVALRLQAIR